MKKRDIGICRNKALGFIQSPKRLVYLTYDYLGNWHKRIDEYPCWTGPVDLVLPKEYI